MLNVLLIFLILAGLLVWAPLMFTVPWVLLRVAGHDPQRNRRSLRPEVWVGLTLVAAAGSAASVALYIVSIPDAPQTPHPSPSFIGWLLLVLLWLLAHVALGGVLAGVVRYGLVARDGVGALIGMGIVTLPLLGLLAGIHLVRLREADVWHSLGAPPEPATRVVGADLGWLAVETSGGTIYRCCTEDGQWQAGHRQPAGLPVVLGQPAVGGEGWICPDCLHAPGLGNKHPAAIPAPPLALTQPTWFSARPSSYGDYTYGGAGIAADGQVWEWRRFGNFLSIRLDQTSFTPAMAHRIGQGGRWGAGIGALGSVALALWLWLRRERVLAGRQ